MVVSRREGSISSNIRAIIEQLNLNPVERRRLIDRTKQDGARCVVGYHQGVQPAAKISIGVYGCKEKVGYEIPGGGPIRRAVCRLGPDRSRPRQEAGQRKILAPIKKEGAAREDAAVEEVIDLEGRNLTSIRTDRRGRVASRHFFFSLCFRGSVQLEARFSFLLDRILYYLLIYLSMSHY